MRTLISNQTYLEVDMNDSHTWISLLELHLDARRYSDADKACDELIRKYPRIYQGWEGKIRIITRNYSTPIKNINEVKLLNNYMSNVKKTADSNVYLKIRTHYLEYLNRTCSSLAEEIIYDAKSLIAQYDYTKTLNDNEYNELLQEYSDRLHSLETKLGDRLVKVKKVKTNRMIGLIALTIINFFVCHFISSVFWFGLAVGVFIVFFFISWQLIYEMDLEKTAEYSTTWIYKDIDRYKEGLKTASEEYKKTTGRIITIRDCLYKFINMDFTFVIDNLIKERLRFDSCFPDIRIAAVLELIEEDNGVKVGVPDYRNLFENR